MNLQERTTHSRFSTRRLLLVACCALGLMLPNLAATAADDTPASREYQVKAAMILNFAQFIEWPGNAFPSADSPLMIGVVGANPFDNALESIVSGKTVSGRGIQVRYFSSPEDIHDCQILFVTTGEDRNLSRIFETIGDEPTFSIGETDAFPWAGGICRFYTEQNRVRFEINPQAAEKPRVKISSKLLKLARIFKR